MAPAMKKPVINICSLGKESCKKKRECENPVTSPQRISVIMPGESAGLSPGILVFVHKSVDGIDEFADFRLRQLGIGADRLALSPDIIIDEGGENNDGNGPHLLVILDELAEAVAVHLGHFDIGDDAVAILKNRPAFLLLAHEVPGFLPIGEYVEIGVAGLVQAVDDELGKKRRILGHNERGLGPVLLLVLLIGVHIGDLETGLGIDIRYNFLEVDDDDQVVIQLQNAGSYGRILGRNRGIRGIDCFPGYPVDAEHFIDMEGRVQIVEIRDEEEALAGGQVFVAQTLSEIDDRDNRIPRHEDSFNEGMGVRDRRDMLIGQDLADLRDIDPVVIVSNLEFENFKLIRT